MISWSGITHFGDVAITSLIALAIAAWLLAEDEKRLALWWSVLFGAGLGVVVATKMAFIGWGIGIRSLDFTGFSGHTMRSAAVMPVLFERKKTTGAGERSAPVVLSPLVLVNGSFPELRSRPWSRCRSGPGAARCPSRRRG